MQIKFLLPLYMVLLTFIGGFADVSSFLISGIFTGHLTGNLVLSTVYGVHQNYHLMWHCIIAIIGFTSGTSLGIWFRTKQEIQLIYKISITFILQLTIVIFIFIINILFNNDTSHIIFFSGLSFALGLQNGIINKLQKIGIHSSYVTGMSTTLINNCITLKKNDPDYTQKVALYKLQLFIILGFVIGALIGVICIHFMQFVGFAILGILLLISIILSIYLQHNQLI